MKVFHPSVDIVIAITKVPFKEALNARERERQAIDNLLRQLLGNYELTHNESGKPELKGWNISISHSLNRQIGFAAVILSRTHIVGIDIEYRSERIMKIADRFLRDDEKPSTVEDNLVYWCAKEAVYKLFSAEDLTYQQMRVNSQMTEVENLKSNTLAHIDTMITNEYVLVWTSK